MTLLGNGVHERNIQGRMNQLEWAPRILAILVVQDGVIDVIVVSRIGLFKICQSLAVEHLMYAVD